MLSGNVYHDDDANRGVIEVIVPSSDAPRPNAQFILTIDISGSMNAPAVCKGENGEDLNQGWSNLDINIHGILTLIGMLKEGDYLCMIVFESNARVLMEWTKMNEDGKNNASSIVRKLRTEGMTNLTSAINKTGELMLKSPLTENVVSSCIIYTDGSPTIDVQRTFKYKQSLEKYKMETYEKKEVTYSIFSMAIGNQLDTELLSNISHVFHIPQTQFLCAFTVNLMAIVLGVYSQENTIFSSSFLTVEGNVNLKKNEYVDCTSVSETQQRVYAGLLVNGINRNFCYTGSKVEYVSINGISVPLTHKKEKEKIDKEHCRLDAIEFIGKKNATKLSELLTSIEDDTLQETVREVILGLNTYYNTWGKHFIFSLSQALLQEFRTNYNDKALQKYTSDKFEEICDMGEEIFSKTTPPEPSLLNNRAQTPTPNMTTNNSTTTRTITVLPDAFLRGGGCFANLKQKLKVIYENRMVDMTIEDIIKYRNVKLLTNNGFSEIECIVSNETNNNTVIMNVDGVYLTEWHPIRINNGEWVFSRNVGTRVESVPSHTFNFVMKNRSNIMVYGNTSTIEYASPGHSKTTKCLDSISFHKYWATELYINDLKKNSTFQKGYVLVPYIEKGNNSLYTKCNILVKTI
tara:strand:+ start:202 stop:2097 length:1896 start_codon:yes stop_codon:yes gene_type:complete